MSNINGGMGRGGRSALSSVDFYRRVPKDLTEVRVIDSCLLVFCDTSNSKQEPATAGDTSIADGAFPLVMCVESRYKTAFQLEIYLMDLGWDIMISLRRQEERNWDPGRMLAPWESPNITKGTHAMIGPPFTHDNDFSPIQHIHVFVLLSTLPSLLAGNRPKRHCLPYSHPSIAFVCCAR